MSLRYRVLRGPFLSCPDEQIIAILREQEAGVDPRRSKEIEGENAKQKKLLAKAMLNSVMLKDSAIINW
jgi:hypothetical protein